MISPPFSSMTREHKGMHMTANEALRSSFDTSDFAMLRGEDEYAHYFNQLTLVFNRLIGAYRLKSAHKDEAAVATHFLTKFLSTIGALRMKYAYASKDRTLWVDLSESGFPHHIEISYLTADLQTRKNRLSGLLSRARVVNLMLDHMIAEHKDPVHLLTQMAERTYLEMLDEEALFFTYTPGLFTLVPSENPTSPVRSYHYQWACFDSVTNRPYLHQMMFEQDVSSEPLTHDGPEREAFDRVMRFEGGRAPLLGDMAVLIDDAIETIHPKWIKRICIGPLYSRLLLQERTPPESGSREHVMTQLLGQYASRDEDFVLFFTHEIIFSREQKTSTGLLSKRRTREIFAVPATDAECAKRRVSMLYTNILMPHYLLQHIGPEMRGAISEFGKARKIAYNQKGDLYEV